MDYGLAGQYDGMILDIMMPGLDGLEVLAKLREQGIATPVLMLTAKTQVNDRITGLDTGADDYLTKPFAMGELLARLRAMMRRRADFAPNVMHCGNITLNRGNFELSNGEAGFRLGNKEFQMMEMLLLHPGQLISSEQLMERIWGYDSDTEISVVWVYISYLRKKLAALGATVEIKATRGVGYMLEDKA